MILRSSGAVRGTGLLLRTQHSNCHVATLGRSTIGSVHRHVQRPPRQFVCQSAEVIATLTATCYSHTYKWRGATLNNTSPFCLREQLIPSKLEIMQVQQQQQQQQSSTKVNRKGQPRSSTQQRSSNGSQSNTSGRSPAAQSSQGADIVLYYYTGWPQAKLHYSMNAEAWQDTDFQPVMPGGMSAAFHTCCKAISCTTRSNCFYVLAGELFEWQVVCSAGADEWGRHPA